MASTHRTSQGYRSTASQALGPGTREARKALDRVYPSKRGRLFDAPKGSLRVYLAQALKTAGLDGRAISVYDFKHCRWSSRSAGI